MTVAAPPRDELLDAVERLTFLLVGITERVLASSTAAADLTLPQWRVLTLLADATVPLRLSDVAAATGLSAPSASRMVARLAGRGFISTTVDLDDRRALRIRLTRPGAKVVREILATRRQRIATALDGLAPRPALVTGLDRIVAAMQSAEGAG